MMQITLTQDEFSELLRAGILAGQLNPKIDTDKVLKEILKQVAT